MECKLCQGGMYAESTTSTACTDCGKKENNYRKEKHHRHTAVNQNAQIVRSESILGTRGQPTVSNVQVQKQREQPLVKDVHRVNR
jgi:DNA-directed RNA polymerase subunit M/transcription elongation factor TFIIS